MVGDYFRTIVELAEPARRLSPRRLPLRSFLGGGESSLEEPRPPLPHGYVEQVEGAGDLFYRDTGRASGRRSQGTVLLLHGWMVPSDPHWFRTFELLAAEGWRVIALDARGHGRGLRDAEPFRLTDCAGDAAALVRHLDCGPVNVVGYSMGGTVAQLMARDHPELVSSLVLCATGCEFQTSLLMRAVWSGMGLWQVCLRLAPQWGWEAALQAFVRGDRQTIAWAVGELRRGAAWDIAEAGREIGRFDSREWLDRLEMPVAVVVTTVDLLVPPERQRDLARRLDAAVLQLKSDHLAPASTPRRFHACLLEALDRVASKGLHSVSSKPAS